MTDLIAPLLAARAGGFRPSPVRDFWEVSMEPGIISLAGGNPDLSVLPLGELGEVAARVIRDRGLEVLQYGGGTGAPGTREAVARTMAAEGIPVDPADVQVTAGSQMALDLVVKLLFDPGDVVLAEGPSYVGAIGLFVGMQVDVVHVPIDDDGLVPAALEETVARLRAEGRRVKALYTIPNFHNPSGVTLAAQRRPDVVRICRDAGITVIEDNPYGLLSFDGASLPSLRSLDPDNVVYLGSFSKVVAPGLRVGWAVAPEPLRRPLQLASEATVICASVLSQAVVEEYVLRHDWLAVLARARRLYESRAGAVLDALAGAGPGVSWSVPRGGFFTWVTLPAGSDVHGVLDAAIERRVVFVPGSAFHADGGGTNQLRLAFSLEKEDVLAEGVRRLLDAIAEVAAA
ncbi:MULTISPECIES: PLP-dependent aminotransferase family protein [unclassified Nocardioides]|uniref:aminotransferase-like domain-containing protein n=1 Tax=unclassified Nocardioides TaxID=2615069 RepID=UPI00116B72AB|nr:MULTISPECIES: PLP-dependent aminotransferase family protein [unclassified Nocardioides]TQK69113.1 DNA-binding transcriptional MocR family regulator [Nocardioides sp. SLBN-35]WGY01581.1 PLP-dependent aminotransferase family protein [Nocardioides sp. QY071]